MPLPCGDLDTRNHLCSRCCHATEQRRHEVTMVAGSVGAVCSFQSTLSIRSVILWHDRDKSPGQTVSMRSEFSMGLTERCPKDGAGLNSNGTCLNAPGCDYQLSAETIVDREDRRNAGGGRG